MKENSIIAGILDNFVNRPNAPEIDRITEMLYPNILNEKEQVNNLRRQLVERLGDEKLLTEFEEFLCYLDALRYDAIYLSGVSDGMELANTFKQFKEGVA